MSHYESKSITAFTFTFARQLICDIQKVRQFDKALTIDSVRATFEQTFGEFTSLMKSKNCLGEVSFLPPQAHLQLPGFECCFNIETMQ